MSLFEYIMVLTSILIGLGIAELLSGIVRMLRSDFKEGFYLPQILWSSFLFLYLIIVWWSRWDLRENFHWTFLQLLMSLAGPVMAFIAAGLMFARNRTAKEYYFRQQKTMFTILPLIAFSSLIHEVVIEGTSLLSFTTFMASLLVISTLLPRFFKKDWIHLVCSFSANAVFIFWVLSSLYLISAR